jgi:cytidylate kinase
MEINNVIIKHYLKNVMFINGTAYAGKSTMVKMLADEYGLIHCGENYDCIPQSIRTPDKFPNMCYFQTMKDWQEFVNRTPEEYARWIEDGSREIEQFEIAYLIRIAEKQKVIVDTNISVDILREIADYNQVALMLCPQSMSVEHFFDRDDHDKKFLKERIMEAENPQKTMKNFRDCMAKINSQEVYDKFANSGFFTLVRKDAVTDTKSETLETLAKHFGLIAP